MTILQPFLIFLLFTGEILLALMLGYLLLLTAAAAAAPRTTTLNQSHPTRRFAILVPAHNEERLLPELLASLKRLDYPTGLFAVHVVADNCTDRTAAIARSAGAHVHERQDHDKIGKGFALDWLMQEIANREQAFDALTIFDADSVVSANFLRVMDARLARGERVVQSYYAAGGPEQGWSVGLRAVALILVNYVRPAGRVCLGGSAGLKGNGMTFAADVARRHRWRASLTEDIDHHLDLLLAGETVTFAPDAVVWAEMPSTLDASVSQHQRWEAGRLQALRNRIPRLALSAFRQRSFRLLDAVIDQLIPPLSVLAAATLGCAILAGIGGSLFATMVAVALMTSLLIYVLAGLVLARAPAALYAALLLAPAYVLWKLRLYLPLLLGGKPHRWIRTKRNQGTG